MSTEPHRGALLGITDLATVHNDTYPCRAKWYNLGIQLRVDVGTLDCFKGQYSDPGDQLREVLRTWLTSSGKSTCGGLIEALKSPVLEEAYLANQLQQKYCPSGQPPFDGQLTLPLEAAPPTPLPKPTSVAANSLELPSQAPTTYVPFYTGNVSTYLSLKDIEIELQEVTAADWFPLGVQLGIRPPKLREIEKDHPSDVWRCKFEALDWWHRNAPDVSWVTLADALGKTGGYDALSQRLRRKMPSKVSSLPREVASSLCSLPISASPRKEETGTGERPTLPKLLNFPVKSGRHINIPQQIGIKYFQFGVQLLNDETGEEIEAITLKYREEAEEINLKILRLWIRGKGKPLHWDSLIEVLKAIGLGTLASDIQDGLHH